jgi:hypothetical protein
MKRDIKKELKYLYNPNKNFPSVVDVPVFNFLMFDGMGDPSTSPIFQCGIESLFSLSYTIKFMVRNDIGIDYGVMPLEGLWWMQNDEIFDVNKRDKWQWTIMIMQPEYVTIEVINKATEKLIKQKKTEYITQIRFEEYNEGKSMQIMHIGPFADEDPNIILIHNEILNSNHQLSGKHHEIYLSDFRKTAPEKLKTILRQPYI